MTNSHVFRFEIAMIIISLILLGGCAGTETAKFYTLSALTTSETKTSIEATGDGPAIGIGPITFPQYLDRPQIVTRGTRNEVKLAEFDRWAGTLQDDFSRVLGENLGILLSTDSISLYPWKGSTQIQYQVAGDVIQFDGDLKGSVTLRFRWIIYSGEDKKELYRNTATFKAPTEGKGYKELVEAQSRAIIDLSREVAKAIRSISL